MKKAIITMVSVLFLLITMATAHATTYTSTGTASADFTFSGFTVPNAPLILSLSNIAVTGTPDLPPYPGIYNWSLDVTSFDVTLTNGGSFAVGPLGPIDIGTYALPLPTTPGAANLGDVIIPFALFGLASSDSLDLQNLYVTWSSLTGNAIDFTITATDMTELKGYLVYLDTLARTELLATNGIGSGHLNFAGSLTAEPVPEPSTMLLLGAGLCGLAIWRKKKS